MDSVSEAYSVSSRGIIKLHASSHYLITVEVRKGSLISPCGAWVCWMSQACCKLFSLPQWSSEAGGMIWWTISPIQYENPMFFWKISNLAEEPFLHTGMELAKGSSSLFSYQIQMWAAWAAEAFHKGRSLLVLNYERNSLWVNKPARRIQLAH